MTTQSSSTMLGSRAAAHTAVLLALYAETPVHAGTGQSTGIVDLPVQRERHTNYPVLPSTSLKGSLRSVAVNRWGETNNGIVDLLFGPRARGGEDSLYAGALALTDARLLAFPVRSHADVFRWVTCPLALGRLARDAQLAGLTLPGLALPDTLRPNDGEAFVADGRTGATILLEDLSVRAVANEQWPQIAAALAQLLPDGEAHRTYREKFARHLMLVSDSDYHYLVTHATQIAARIALNEHKTTSGGEGNLWYEETVPADSLFTALALPGAPRGPRNGSSPASVRQRFLELVAGNPFYLQVGGNETVGQGWCAVRVLEGERNGNTNA